MSRTVFLGKPTAKQKTMYEAVRFAQQEAIHFITNQLAKGEPIEASQPDSVAREYIVAHGFPEYPHSLGHGIGLEVHEPPRLSPYANKFLQEGMVFSIEPGIYLPGEGGVRIEDLFAIENGKLRQLTKASSDLLVV